MKLLNRAIKVIMGVEETMGVHEIHEISERTMGVLIRAIKKSWVSMKLP